MEKDKDKKSYKDENVIDCLNKVILSTEAQNLKVSNYGVTKEYNAKNRARLWDSEKAKRNFKDMVFADKKTHYDPISRKTLHKYQNAAKNKYGQYDHSGNLKSNKWVDHTTDIDHITALKEVHKNNKNNPFLNDHDIKEIANHPTNFRAVSKRYNTSKGAKSDYSEIFNNSDLDVRGRLQIAKEKVIADLSMDINIARKTGQHIFDEAAIGVKNTVTNPIVLSHIGVTHAIRLLSGNETPDEARDGIIKDISIGAVTGGGMQVIGTGLQSIERNTPLVADCLKRVGIGPAAMIGTTIAVDVVRYMSGTIGAGELAANMVGTSLTIAGGMVGGGIGTVLLPGLGTEIGAYIGSLIGNIVGSIVVSGIYSIIQGIKDLDLYKKELAFVKRVETLCIQELHRLRGEFLAISQAEYVEKADLIDKGYGIIYEGIISESSSTEKIAQGMDLILSAYGYNVKCKSLDEFRKQLGETVKITL